MIEEDYDILISEDAHDIDAVKISDEITKPNIIRKTIRGKRADIILIPSTLGVYDVLPSDFPSFQPISFMILTNGEIITDKGRQLVERLSNEVQIQEIHDAYIGASACFLNGINCPEFLQHKNYIARKRSDAPITKQIVPLHRVACDLLPRALYIRKFGSLPTDMDDKIILEETGMLQTCLDVDKQFTEQNPKDVDKLYDILNRALEEVYTPIHSKIFNEVIGKTGQNI